MQDLFRKEILESQQVLENFLAQDGVFQTLEDIASCMVESILHGGKIISCGNGGSMTDAMHFAEELCGKFRNERQALPAIAISDPSYISCVANDYGFQDVFSRFIEGLGAQGDVLLAISTSGNSENVLRAVAAAKNKGMFVVGLTGKDGGKLKQESDFCICVPHNGYADRIQEIHIKVIHSLICVLERELV